MPFVTNTDYSPKILNQISSYGAIWLLYIRKHKPDFDGGSHSSEITFS